MTITTYSPFAEWQFYLYIVASVVLFAVWGVLGQKVFDHMATAAKLLDAEGELEQFMRSQFFQIAGLLSFLLLIWIASGVFYFSYLFYVLGIGVALLVVRRALMTVLGLETLDMKRRIATMHKLGGSVIGAGLSLIMMFGLGFFVTTYLIYKVISLRYSPVPAEQARLEMLLWVFGGQALYGLLLFLPLYGFTMLRPALDPFVRVHLFLLSLFAVGGLVIALSLPYALFAPEVRAKVLLLPGDINSIYWIAGGFFALFGSCFLIGTFAHSAQRRELLEKADIWLSELEDAQRPGPKSEFRMERSVNSALETPRMIGELIRDDIYLAAFWLWRYPELRDGMKAFAHEATSLTRAVAADDAPPPALLTQEPRSPSLPVSAPAGPLGLPALSDERSSPHLDTEAVTRRFGVEVQRSLGFLWGDKSGFYDAQVKQHAERFSADVGALARWNPRVRLLIGYTELMRVLNQRERVLEIVEDLKTNIEELRGERNHVLARGLTLSTLGGGAVTIVVQLIKAFALGD